MDTKIEKLAAVKPLIALSKKVITVVPPIKSDVEYKNLGEQVKAAAASRKMIDAVAVDVLSPMRAALDEILQKFAHYKEPHEQFEAAARAAMIEWNRKKNLLAAAQQKKIDAVAEREKAKLAKQADALEDEVVAERRAVEKELEDAEALETAARGRADRAKLLRDTPPNRLKRAQANEDLDHARRRVMKARAAIDRLDVKAGKAERLADEARNYVAPIVQASTARVAGIAPRTLWKFEVIDQSKIKREYLTPDVAEIGRIVRSLHADAGNVVGPGALRIYNEDSLSVGS